MNLSYLVGLLKHGISISKAYLVDITHTDQRPSVLAHFNAISSAGVIIGQPISGHLAEFDPTFHLSLLVGACVYAVNFILALILLPSSERVEKFGNRFGISSQTSTKAVDKLRHSEKGFSEKSATANSGNDFGVSSAVDNQ